MLVQYEGCFPRAQGCFLPSTFSQCEGRFCIRGCSACWCHAPEHVSPMRGVLLSSALPSPFVQGEGCFGREGGNPAFSLVPHSSLSQVLNLPFWGLFTS